MLKNTCLSLLAIAVCVHWLPSSLQAQTEAQRGAVLGGVAGAVIGGIAGKQNDETPEGIAIGGVAGAIAGGLLGRAKDNQNMQRYQYQQAQAAQQSYQMSRAVSIGDAIAMSRSGVSPNLIVSQIRANGVQQQIGVSEVIQLHENGVPELVIQEMQRANIGSPAPVTVVEERPVIVQQRPTVIVESYPVYRPAPVFYGPPHHAHLHYYHNFHR